MYVPSKRSSQPSHKFSITLPAPSVLNSEKVAFTGAHPSNVGKYLRLGILRTFRKTIKFCANCKLKSSNFDLSAKINQAYQLRSRPSESNLKKTNFCNQRERPLAEKDFDAEMLHSK